MILWLTGLPCSGKTTIGKALLSLLKQEGRAAELLDGDEVRGRLWPELGFTREDRYENVRRLGMMANFLSKQKIIVIVSAISPYRASRDAVREQSERFIEVYVNTPLEVCEERDVKGMYAKARAGEIAAFTGVSDPYEPPINPEVECRADVETIEESVSKVVQAVDAGVLCFTGNGDGV